MLAWCGQSVRVGLLVLAAGWSGSAAPALRADGCPPRPVYFPSVASPTVLDLSYAGYSSGAIVAPPPGYTGYGSGPIGAGPGCTPAPPLVTPSCVPRPWAAPGTGAGK